MGNSHFSYMILNPDEQVSLKDSLILIFIEDDNVESSGIKLGSTILSLDRNHLLFLNQNFRIKNLGPNSISLLKISKSLFQRNNFELLNSIYETLSRLEVENFRFTYESRKLLISYVTNLKEAQLYLMFDKNFELSQLISILIMLTNEFFKKMVQSSFDQESKMIKEKKLLNEILLHLENNINRKISLRELEKIFFTNRTYLNEIFNEHMNYSLGQYQMKLKIDRSLYLLKNEELSMQNIAEILGFYDTAHFSKTFKKFMGKAPSEYRE